MKEQFLVIAIIVASVWLGSEVLSIANRSTGAELQQHLHFLIGSCP